METKVPLIGFIGGSYRDNNPRYDCQRTLNYYLQQDEQSAGKEQQVVELLQRPGLSFLQNFTPNDIRALYTVSNSEIAIVVCGNQVYQISGSLSIPINIVGTMATSSGYVSIADNGISVFLVDGTNGYYFDIGTFILTTVVPNSIATPDFYASSQVTFQDGYFIFQGGPSDNSIFISDVYSTSFLPLNYAAKAGYPDPVVGLISNAREVFIFGTQTTEVWYDAGISGSSPFVREDGKNNQTGCISAATIVQLAGTVFYLGQNPQGGAIVYYMNGYTPTRCSTHAVEFALQSAGDLSGAVAFGMQYEGHYFYVLNLPGGGTTWVFDASAITETNPTPGAWVEWGSQITPGIDTRWLGQTHCVLNGEHLIGDFNSGNLYLFDAQSATDNGAMMRRVRQSPHVSKNLNMIFYGLLQIDFLAGQGLVNNGTNPPNAVNPTAWLEESNDGGQTFDVPIPTDLGRIGQYYARARWCPLSASNDKVFRVTITDPIITHMITARVDFTLGTA